MIRFLSMALLVTAIPAQAAADNHAEFMVKLRNMKNLPSGFEPTKNLPRGFGAGSNGTSSSVSSASSASSASTPGRLLNDLHLIPSFQRALGEAEIVKSVMSRKVQWGNQHTILPVGIVSTLRDTLIVRKEPEYLPSTPGLFSAFSLPGDRSTGFMDAILVVPLQGSHSLEKELYVMNAANATARKVPILGPELPAMTDPSWNGIGYGQIVLVPTTLRLSVGINQIESNSGAPLATLHWDGSRDRDGKLVRLP